jgi:DNA-binding XRE family transcriptional regulator
MSIEKLRQALAIRLKESRRNSGLSQDEAGAAVGLPRLAVTLIESGARKVEAVELAKFSNLYGKDVEWLLFDIIKKNREKMQALETLMRGLSEDDLEHLERFVNFLRNSPKRSRQRV